MDLLFLPIISRGVFSLPQKELFHLSGSKYRVWTVLCSLALGIAGLFFCFSVIAAFFGRTNVLAAPGSFFVRSYGLLSFVIPAYLLYAAFLLADPNYKPGRIFLLCGLIIPFITLALGSYWIREFEILRIESSFINRAGKTGIGIFIFIVSVLEILIIIFLRFLLFPRNRDPRQEKMSAVVRREKTGSTDKTPQSAKSGSRNLRDIYAEAAAALAVEKDYSTTPYIAGVNADKTEASPADISLYASADISDTSHKISPAADADVSVKVPVSGIPAEDTAMVPAVRASAVPSVGIMEAEVSTKELVSLTGSNDDVEKALAEATALAEEETARHDSHGRDKKNSADSPGKKTTRERKRRVPYFVPVEGILKQYPDGEYWIIDDETRNAALTLKETFKEFNIQVEVTGIRKGPVITMFEILPAPGIRLAKIENLADNIALRLAAQSVRIVAPIPGKHAVGVEVPNARRNIVSFREIIEGELNRDGKKSEIPIVLGKDITGEAVTVDLVQMPHLLIAGATGSGKSVCVNSMILTILYQKTPAECRLILIDPKIVELKLYNDIPHLLTPVITEPKKAFQALQYCIYEMERRYACLDSMGVRDIRSYNRRIKERDIATEYMPYIVVVIDEFADLMATTGKELESTVARLAAMSRAVGIHLVLATQRPSIDIITGLIKANIPSRIAFMVAGRMNSQIIIDSPGAEKLLGKGDMLYAGALDPYPIRLQGAFISEEEVERVVDYVKSLGEPDYIDDEIFYDEEEEDADPSLFSDGEDPLYEKALEIVMQQGKASASYIQRRLKIGYNRAARLVEFMEHQGVVGPAQGSKPRELLRGV